MISLTNEYVSESYLIYFFHFVFLSCVVLSILKDKLSVYFSSKNMRDYSLYYNSKCPSVRPSVCYDQLLFKTEVLYYFVKISPRKTGNK